MGVHEVIIGEKCLDLLLDDLGQAGLPYECYREVDIGEVRRKVGCPVRARRPTERNTVRTVAGGGGGSTVAGLRDSVSRFVVRSQHSASDRSQGSSMQGDGNPPLMSANRCEVSGVT